MAVEVDGEGDAVLMIHGLGGTSNTWAPLMPALGRFRTIRPDLPGSGRSHRVEGALSIDGFVQAVRHATVAVGADRAHVVAHSMGTIVAAHLAVEEPRLVRSLVLFGPLLAPPDPARTAIRARGQKAIGEGVEGMQAIADALLQTAVSADTRARQRTAVAFVRETLMRQDPDGYGRTCAALADAQPADTTHITCPTLLVTGDEDAVAPPQAVRSMGEKIAGCRVEVLRGCGHWTPVERPAECTDLLSRFLQQRF
jgi:3-oxoadipate enol-lactonase